MTMLQELQKPVVKLCGYISSTKKIISGEMKNKSYLFEVKEVQCLLNAANVFYFYSFHNNYRSGKVFLP